MGEEKRNCTIATCYSWVVGVYMFCFVFPYTEFVVKKEDTGISNATTI